MEAFLSLFSAYGSVVALETHSVCRELWGTAKRHARWLPFHNSGAARIPLKCRLPSGGSYSVPQVERRMLRACKAGVTWMEGGRPKQDPVPETEENEVHWEGSCPLSWVQGHSREQLCAAGEQRLHPLRVDSTILQSLLDHHWEQQSLGGLNDSDFSH